jgi:diadenosine tetraphosphate (Ap4A) HIT family hydrolase
MQKKFVYIENAGSEEYKKKLQIIDDLGIDPFGRQFIEDPRFDPKKILYETPYWFAFENQHKYPGTKHQFVIVSQRYAETFSELSIGAYADLFAIGEEILSMYKIKGGGYLFYSRFGDPKNSGATVYHLHAQIIVPEEGHRVAAWFGSEKK